MTAGMPVSSPWKALFAVVAAFVLGQLIGGLGLIGGAGVLLVLGKAALKDLGQEPALRALLLHPLPVGFSIVGTQAALAITTLAFAKIGRLPFLEAVSLRNAGRKLRALDVVLGVLMVLALGPLADAAAVLIARTFPGFTLGAVDMISGLVRGDLLTAIVLGFLIAFAPAFSEEVLFRGLFMRAFLRFGPVVGIGFSSLMFGLIHVDPPQATSAAILGLALGFVTYRTKWLFPAMAAHAANNGLAVLFARYGEAKSMAEIPIVPLEVAGSAVVTLVLGAAVFYTTRERPAATAQPEGG